MGHHKESTNGDMRLQETEVAEENLTLVSEERFLIAMGNMKTHLSLTSNDKVWVGVSTNDLRAIIDYWEAKRD